LKKFEKKQIYFYRTISKAEIDFVVEKSYKKYLLIECKYRNKKSSIPVVMKNFEDYYGVSQKIIITKDYLEKSDNVFYIPAFLFAFIDL
jgi:predicted AAA+ superfamily ATPase